MLPPLAGLAFFSLAGSLHVVPKDPRIYCRRTQESKQQQPGVSLCRDWRQRTMTALGLHGRGLATASRRSHSRDKALFCTKQRDQSALTRQLRHRVSSIIHENLAFFFVCFPSFLPLSLFPPRARTTNVDHVTARYLGTSSHVHVVM